RHRMAFVRPCEHRIMTGPDVGRIEGPYRPESVRIVITTLGRRILRHSVSDTSRTARRFRVRKADGFSIVASYAPTPAQTRLPTPASQQAQREADAPRRHLGVHHPGLVRPHTASRHVDLYTASWIGLHAPLRTPTLDASSVSRYLR